MNAHSSRRVPVAMLQARYFGTSPGSPPGVPGGGMTGVTPPPTGGTEMPGSMPAGGQITPLERDNSSLKLALPVVSPGRGRTKPPLLAWQPRFGAGTNGGAGRSCAAARQSGCDCGRKNPSSHGDLLT
jgi:hypothetical protein